LRFPLTQEGKKGVHPEDGLQKLYKGWCVENRTVVISGQMEEKKSAKGCGTTTRAEY